MSSMNNEQAIFLLHCLLPTAALNTIEKNFLIMSIPLNLYICQKDNQYPPPLFFSGILMTSTLQKVLKFDINECDQYFQKP